METGATREASSGPRVVALGDSVTFGVGDKPCHGVGPGWAAHVAYALGASTFTNLAANGVRARHLEWSQVPTALMERPDVVLVSVGGNDVLRGDFQPPEITVRVRDAVQRLERPGRLMVALSLDSIALFSLLGPRIESVMSRRIASANEALLTAFDGTSVRVVDGAAAFAAAGDSAWHIDRIHPSPLGHRALANAALAALAPEMTAVRDIAPPGASPSLSARAWWLTREGAPWIAKRSRDLIPQIAAVVTHELLEERRARRPSISA